MKIQRKLSLGFVLVNGLFLVSTLISFWAINANKNSAHKVEEMHLSLEAVEDLKEMATELSLTLVDIVLDKEFDEENEKFLDSFKQELIEDRKVYLAADMEPRHRVGYVHAFEVMEKMLKLGEMELIPALDGVTRKEEFERIAAELRELRASLLSGLGEVAKVDREQIIVAKAEEEATSSKTKTLLILVLIFGAGMGIGAAFVIGRQIMTPLMGTLNILKGMSTGDADLNQRVPAKTHDELGELAGYFNDFLGNLQGTINEIIGSAETSVAVVNAIDQNSTVIQEGTDEMMAMSGTISAATEEINVNMSTMASSSEEASANVNSITAVVEELSANMNTIAAAAEEASVNMSGIAENVSTISQDIEQVISKNATELSTSLQDINERTKRAQAISLQANKGAEDNQKAMTELNEVTQQIGQILQLVNNIASQTNMLALNATIEAASAGQAGKGFAVVAGEVKELAKQTTDANNEIAEQIDQVQELVQKTLARTAGVSQVIMQVSEINQGISSLISEQSTNANALEAAVGNVSDSLRNSSINVEEAATGIKEITRSTAEAGQAAKSAAKNVAEAAVGVKETARSTAEIAVGLGEISSNIGRMDQVISENVKQNGRNIENIGRLVVVSTGMKDTINVFNKNSDIFFYWSKELMVGNHTIDTQHQEIVVGINELYLSKQQGKPTSEQARILTDLIKVTVNHFSDEQKLFMASEYPEKEAHLERHRKIIAQLKESCAKIESGSASVDDELLDFLKDWLQSHIMIVDSGYADYI